MKKILCMMATAAMLIACGKEEPDYSAWYQDRDDQDNVPEEPSGYDLSVMSFNVRNYKGDQNTANSWENRKPGVYEMINTEKPMVIGLQECYVSQREDITGNCSGYSFYGVGRDDGARSGETTSILYNSSLLTMVTSGTFWLSTTPETPSIGWDAAHNRTVTWIRFRMKGSGQEFLHFNTHLDNEGSTAKEESIKLIQERISSINTDNLPVVLTGDFNCAQTDAIFDNLDLENARTEAGLSDNYNTSNGYGNSKESQIDHIFYSGMTPLTFETIRDRWSGLIYISDHWPVYAKFNFEK